MIGLRRHAATSSDRLDRWLREEYRPGAEGLSLFRIGYASSMLLLLGTNLTSVAGLPDSFLNPPPGPLVVLRAVPPSWVMGVTEVALGALLIALLVGYRTPAVSVSFTVIAVLAHGVLYSFGKIDHGFLLWAVPAILAPSGWGAAPSLDARAGRAPNEAQAWPLAVLAIVIGISMFTAGFGKAITGWLDPTTHAAWGYAVHYELLQGREALLSWAVPTRNPSLLWEAADLGTIAVECGVLLAVVRRRALGQALVILVLMHFSIFLLMTISFSWAPIVYAAFLPWGAIHERSRSRTRSLDDTWGTLGYRPFASLVVFVGALILVSRWIVGAPLNTVLSAAFGRYTPVFILSVETVIALAAAGAGWRALRQGRPTSPAGNPDVPDVP